ncbi:Solute carrier family 25 member 40 [Trichoplax sp. H2]|nr:Solute carrier family 25 member 40 [Trichoplax sp. H2]|eukprot:RDD37285.1 Solute carrier family 25 member 40 [Trichoplax sp. H2]
MFVIQHQPEFGGIFDSDAIHLATKYFVLPIIITSCFSKIFDSDAIHLATKYFVLPIIITSCFSKIFDSDAIHLATKYFVLPIIITSCFSNIFDSDAIHLATEYFVLPIIITSCFSKIQQSLHLWLLLELMKEKVLTVYKSNFSISSMDTKGDQNVVRITAAQKLASSCFGAMATAVIVTPFDVIKTRMQIKRNARLAKAPISESVPYVLCNGLMDHKCTMCPETMMKNCRPTMWGTFVNIIRNEGPSALYRGLPPTLIMAIPSTMIFFTAYDILKEKLTPHLGKRQDVLAPMLSAMLARVTVVTAISPMELVRTKMQASKTAGYGELVRIVYQEAKISGVSTLWRGLGTTLMRDLPFSAFYWAGYENFKKRFNTLTNGKYPNISNFSAGATSGMIVAAATTPFDVVKTHLQVDMGETNSKNGSQKVPSMFAIMNNIRQQYGVRGLYTGVAARVIKVAPASAIMISTYEFCKDYFAKKNRLT